jgi:hypothetical protein
VKLSEFNVRGNFYHPADPVQGTERTTGVETEYLHDVRASLQPTSIQRLSVRQAGEVVSAQWTLKIEPVGVQCPRTGDIFKLVSACFVNDPTGVHEGARFEVRDVAATTTEVRLSVAEADL